MMKIRGELNEMGTSEDTGTWQLRVSFPDQSPSFAHGFEAGKLWERMSRWAGLMQDGSTAVIEVDASSENREVIRRMADNLGWTVEIEGTSVDGWDRVTLTKSRDERQKPNPHGLRIV